MKGSISLKLFLAAVALSIAGSALPGSLTQAQLKQAAQRDVIVILRDQLPNVPRTRGARHAARDVRVVRPSVATFISTRSIPSLEPATKWCACLTATRLRSSSEVRLSWSCKQLG
jgi:hypothetical protein